MEQNLSTTFYSNLNYANSKFTNLRVLNANDKVQKNERYQFCLSSAYSS